MDSLIAFIVGGALGAVAAWLPYSNAALALFILLPAIYVARLAFDSSFRESRKASRQLALFAGFWIAIAFFQMRPSGLNAMLEPTQIESARVGFLIDEWRKKAPNVEFECAPEIAEKRISIHTITKISIAEAVEIVEHKAEAQAIYERSEAGRSIAAGPHVKVYIGPRQAPEIGEENEQAGKDVFRFEVY